MIVLIFSRFQGAVEMSRSLQEGRARDCWFRKCKVCSVFHDRQTQNFIAVQTGEQVPRSAAMRENIIIYVQESTHSHFCSDEYITNALQIQYEHLTVGTLS